MEIEGSHKGSWKIDKNDEACYIDVEESEEEEDDPNKIYSDWNILPDILLERIFSYLAVKERYYASLVCRNWYFGFHLPPVWSTFIVDDFTLTRPKYNYYSGWQYVLDHQRTQQCLTRIGKYVKGLEFRPENSFNNLYQFMTLLNWCMEKSHGANCPKELKGIGDKIKSLVYLFPCNMSQTEDPQGIKLFGTGGELLAILKKLLSKLQNLKILKLVDLVLDRYEARHLLDGVLDINYSGMKYLNLVNVTTVHCPIMHVGLFMNLQVLVMSPQNVDDDIIILLTDSNVKHLHLFQNRYTPRSETITSCSSKAWKIVKRDNPDLKVHIRVESCSNGEFVFQPEAPVCSILYCSPKANITPDILLRIVDNYKKHLTVFGHEMLPRFVSPKSFHSRIDSLLILLARECYNINTLVIREKISTATALLLAKTLPNLKYLYIRKFCCIIRCDWPKNPEWSDGFYAWLKSSCKTYESVEQEISYILGIKWKFLTDEQYKKIEVNVRNLSATYFN